ncbi:hypothetical protein GCM10010219_41880 [Streptomyces netropsis]|nr:hypothetical protein GCM10010219_41880 [Streptomyces netropsis]
MEIETADQAPTHLHGSEVGVAREGERRQLLGGRRPTVALNNKRGMFAHGATLRLHTNEKVNLR